MKMIGRLFVLGGVLVCGTVEAATPTVSGYVFLDANGK